MKIGISAKAPDLEGSVADRFGTAPFLLVVDSETMKFEAVSNPGASSASQAGISGVVLAISNRIDLLITGYISPTAERHLVNNGITVIRQVEGGVMDALERFGKKDTRPSQPAPDEFLLTVKKTAGQFLNIIPVMAGVVLMIGLFQALVGKKLLAAFFSKGEAVNTLLGACVGSLFTGNAVNSYIIGGSLIENGVEIGAVTAFIVAWVSVGIFQLPAEIDALGKRFALTRNGFSFAASIAIAFATALIMRVF